MIYILIGLLSIAVPVAAVAGFVLALQAGERLRGVERRLSSIEAALAARKEGPSPAEAVKPEVAAEPEAPAEPAAETPSAAPPSAVPPVPDAPAPDAAAPPSLEQRIGTRWSVWVGGLALALGGLLLVRHAIEAGWIGPGVRIVLGLLLSAALAAAGEWLRRHEPETSVGGLPSAHIPSVLIAAATVTAFGTLYAAHALYGFIGPAFAFLLLALVGLSAMLGSALYGPAVAGLGLAASFVTPLLVSSEAPDPWPVVLFIAVVSAAAEGLARLRCWLWLAICAIAGAAAWGLALALGAPPEPSWTWPHAALLHAVVQTAIAAFSLALLPHLAASDETAEPDWIADAALAVLAALVVLVLATARDAPLWSYAALAAIAILAATAWRSAPASAAAVLSGTVALSVGIVWALAPVPVEPVALPLPTNDIGIPVVAPPVRVPGEVKFHLAWSSAAVLLVAVMAALRLLGGSALRLSVAAPYAIAATVPPLLALIVSYLRITEFDRSLVFALAGAALAALFTLGAERFLRAEASEPSPAIRLGTGALAAAAVAALSLALVFVLERGYLTVALALAALGTAVVERRLDVPALRAAIVALGAVVALRLGWEPRIMGDGVGRLPVLNWLLLGYGVPAAAYWAAAGMLRARRQDMAVHISEALAVLFTALLVFFEIRHALNGGDPLRADSGHVEQGLFALTALGLAHLLRRLDLARSSPVLEVATLILSGLAGLAAAVGLGLAWNPLLTDEPVTGAPLFSSLLLAYAVPAAFAAYVANETRRSGPAWYALAVGAFAAALVFGYVTLEVRHLFQGAQIGLWSHPASDREMVAISIAWVLLGSGMLAYGLSRGALAARIASAVIIVLAVVKVFVFDLSDMAGIWRALSFIGLGLALVAIGLVYQRLVFRDALSPAREDAPKQP